MCGRFTLRTPTPVLIKQFQLSAGPILDNRYNIAPTQTVPVIRLEPNKRRELSLVRWGLIPSWAKELAIGNRMINARSETAAEKPAFRSAFKKRRCLVIADGYYEWSLTEKRKQPYLIQMQDRSPFAMAGLWERWTDPAEESTLETCTILTTESNAATAHLHERMPVVLDSSDYEMWLDPEFRDADFLESLMKPFEPEEMTVDLASTYVNNAKHEGPACLESQRELF